MSSQLHPLDLLLRMSPLALVQSLVYSFLVGEQRDIFALISELSPATQTLLGAKLAANGTIAFLLNYISFTTNKKTSPLTMTVAANLKQCLSIILGVWVFRLQVGWVNALGIVIALSGGAWYAKVELGNVYRRSEEEYTKENQTEKGVV
jgi:Triose-phosphate Transporter family